MRDSWQIACRPQTVSCACLALSWSKKSVTQIRLKNGGAFLIKEHLPSRSMTADYVNGWKYRTIIGAFDCTVLSVSYCGDSMPYRLHDIYLKAGGFVGRRTNETYNRKKRWVRWKIWKYRKNLNIGKSENSPRARKGNPICIILYMHRIKEEFMK